MEKDRFKWNERYADEGYYFSLAPSAFLEQSYQYIERFAPGKRVLDIACGEGRNAIFLAKRGFEVTAIDISEQGLAKGIQRCVEEGVQVNFVQADLETFTYTQSYDVILNFNFLLRDLLRESVAALSPGGLLIFETIMDSPTLDGIHTKEFLLQPGELKKIFRPLDGELLLLQEDPCMNPPVGRVIYRRTTGAASQVPSPGGRGVG